MPHNTVTQLLCVLLLQVTQIFFSFLLMIWGWGGGALVELQLIIPPQYKDYDDCSSPWYEPSPSLAGDSFSISSLFANDETDVSCIFTQFKSIKKSQTKQQQKQRQPQTGLIITSLTSTRVPVPTCIITDPANVYLQ